MKQAHNHNNTIILPNIKTIKLVEKSMENWEERHEQKKSTTSLRFCEDLEGSFETSTPRASIFARNSTSSWFDIDSTCGGPLPVHCYTYAK